MNNNMNPMHVTVIENDIEDLREQHLEETGETITVLSVWHSIISILNDNTDHDVALAVTSDGIKVTFRAGANELDVYEDFGRAFDVLSES